MPIPILRNRRKGRSKNGLKVPFDIRDLTDIHFKEEIYVRHIEGNLERPGSSRLPCPKVVPRLRFGSGLHQERKDNGGGRFRVRAPSAAEAPARGGYGWDFRSDRDGDSPSRTFSGLRDSRIGKEHGSGFRASILCRQASHTRRHRGRPDRILHLSRGGTCHAARDGRLCRRREKGFAGRPRRHAHRRDQGQSHGRFRSPCGRDGAYRVCHDTRRRRRRSHRKASRHILGGRLRGLQGISGLSRRNAHGKARGRTGSGRSFGRTRP